MNTVINLLGRDIKLSASNVGEVDRFPGGTKPDGGHFKFRVRVTVGGKFTTFDYYTSVRDYQEGKDTMSADDLKTAFYNFLGDARLGLETFEDFCVELGYDTDSRRAEKMWKACKASAKKLANMGYDDHDLVLLANEFSEKYPDNV